MICICAHVGTWTFFKIDLQEEHGLIVIETVIEIVIKIVASCIPISLFASRPAAAVSLRMFKNSLNCFRFSIFAYS